MHTALGALDSPNSRPGCPGCAPHHEPGAEIILPTQAHERVLPGRERHFGHSLESQLVRGIAGYDECMGRVQGLFLSPRQHHSPVSIQPGLSWPHPFRSGFSMLHEKHTQIPPSTALLFVHGSGNHISPEADTIELNPVCRPSHLASHQAPHHVNATPSVKHMHTVPAHSLQYYSPYTFTPPPRCRPPPQSLGPGPHRHQQRAPRAFG